MFDTEPLPEPIQPWEQPPIVYESERGISCRKIQLKHIVFKTSATLPSLSKVNMLI